MGASGSTEQFEIRDSKEYYDKTDIDLCTCTPPAEICVWGSVCAIPLRNTVRMKMQLLEKASGANATAEDKENLQNLQRQAYCCHGFTFNALQQMVVAGALDSMDNDAGSTASALYQASFVMRMRSQLTGDTSGSLATCLESCVCGACVNCNNAYVVHRAVDRFLKPKPRAVVAEQPTSMLLF